MVPTLKKNKKIVGGKKILTNVPIAPLYNVYSHYKESFLNGSLCILEGYPLKKYF